MSFDKCMKEGESIEQKDVENKSPALVEKWLDKSYDAYCNAALAAMSRTQKEKALASIQRSLERKRVFYADNPRRCGDINGVKLRNISKTFYWMSYLQLVSDERVSDFEHLTDKIDLLVDDFEAAAPELSRDSILSAMAEGTHNSSVAVKGLILFKKAKFFFNSGVVYGECNEVKLAKYNFEEIQRPVEEFYRVFNDAQKISSVSSKDRQQLDEIKEEVRILEGETLTEMTQVIGRLSLAAANEKHEEVMKNQETLDFELVYYVYDLYHHALSQVRDKDVELEAEILSIMGTYQLKVLKMPNSRNKAKNYYTKCIELALSLHPKNVTTEKWYKDAEDNLRDLQKDVLKSEHEKDSEEKQKYTKELLEVSQFLDDRRSPADYQLKNEILAIIEKYPPKVQGFDAKNFGASDELDSKKVLRKAIQIYHPDKQPKEDRLWFWTSERITMFLTELLSKVKTGSSNHN